MPRFAIIILAVVAVGCAGALAWVLARPFNADPRVATLEADLKTARKEITHLREQLKRKDMEGTVHTATTVPSTLPIIPPDPSAAPAPQAPAAGGDTVAGLRDALATPGMKSVLEEQQARQIDAGYGKLFTQLGLNDEERANFRQVLLDREKEVTDFTMKLLDPNLSAGQRQQLVSALQGRKDLYEQNIKTFLNDEKDFQTFKQWEDTLPERVQFDMIGRNVFAQEPLNDQQEQQLVDVSARLRKSTPPSFDPATVNTSQMTESVIAAYEVSLKRRDEQVAAESAAFMTPSQVKLLQNYQEQVRQMAVTAMKMSAVLSGK